MNSTRSLTPAILRNGGLCALTIAWLWAGMTAPSNCRAEELPRTIASDDSDAVFGLTKIWPIHIRVSSEAWKTMQPAGGGFPGMGFPPPPGAGPGRPPGPPAGGPGAGPGGPPGAGRPGFRPGSFGFEFEYVRGTVEIGETRIADVGIRFKGNGTYMMAQSGRRRSFKIDFNEYKKDQRFHGLQQLNLHNNIMDPTRVRQALSYPVFAAAGIPSPRTAFAEVSLTIEGETENEFLGLYTVVEEVDKAFLRRHYGNDKGLLMKPEGTQGLQYMGDKWSDYEWYEAKSKPTDEQAQRVMAAARLVDKGSDEEFREGIESVLDVDQFLRFLAANTLLSNMDSFLTQVHNYYLYLPAQSDKLVFFPWDLDLSLGAFNMIGSAQQLRDLSIDHPHVGQNKLIDRLLTIDKYHGAYRNHLQRLTETQLGPEGELTRNIPIVREATDKLIVRELQMDLDSFRHQRLQSIRSQLSGKSPGWTPQPPTFRGFGPPPGGAASLPVSPR